MLFTNLPTPLPWYEKVIMQDRFRQNVAENIKICQLAPKDGLLPFQFAKVAASELPVTWKIKCCSLDATIDNYLNGYTDPVVVDLTSFIATALTYATLDGLDYFMLLESANSANFITPTLADGLVSGVYYMEMGFLNGGYPLDMVSEIFRVPVKRFLWNNLTTCDYINLKWFHDSDLKPIHYPAGGAFYHRLYLDTFITASEPQLDIIAEKDGNDELFPTFQKAIIKYRVSAAVPDFIKVALFLMQMHDRKTLTTEKAIRTGELKNIEVSSTLAPDGAYSFVEILFEQMQLITDTSCSDDMVEPDSFTITGGQTLNTEYCDGSGDVTGVVTTAMAVGVYGELWAKVGLVYVLVNNYISYHEMITGFARTITPALGATKFKIKYRTFSFYVTGESTESIPVASC